ncbi:DNA alkylation repair protein [Rhodococcus sp. IEGM 1366]|uniref:DNA alkylation repair protein n=1 Tax=Rhodococcus sp. IEGM 1366 TaxID=3082223 RepID=UPI0029530210|nr:DNA alkylation repair protein [Rhodococcus sp. IEGM 1366]MDV8068479.1 DNA alkylation repair protein [Rhodococcus sp. IEGM 1366]
MPTADELLGASVVADLALCLEQASGRTRLAAVRESSSGFDGLSLGERTRVVRDAMMSDLPEEFPRFAEVIRLALRDEAFAGWMIWPVTEAVAVIATRRGRNADFDDGMALLAELTSRLTSEFAIRTFLDANPARALEIALGWTDHQDEHVRRLASEGTRMRLPWGRRVKALTEHPESTVSILDALYRDDSEYVRRSVANHLNDLSRADAALAVSIAKRWLGDPDAATPKVVRHALRSLVKAGDVDALALLGFAAPTDIVISDFVIDRDAVDLGGDIAFGFAVSNNGGESVTVAIDYIVHHVKANGLTSPKVFKLTTRALAPGASAKVAKRHSFKPISTRRYYAGTHSVELQINGVTQGLRSFQLEVAADDN